MSWGGGALWRAGRESTAVLTRLATEGGGRGARAAGALARGRVCHGFSLGRRDGGALPRSAADVPSAPGRQCASGEGTRCWRGRRRIRPLPHSGFRRYRRGTECRRRRRGCEPGWGRGGWLTATPPGPPRGCSRRGGELGWGGGWLAGWGGGWPPLCRAHEPGLLPGLSRAGRSALFRAAGCRTHAVPAAGVRTAATPAVHSGVTGHLRPEAHGGTPAAGGGHGRSAGVTRRITCADEPLLEAAGGTPGRLPGGAHHGNGRAEGGRGGAGGRWHLARGSLRGGPFLRDARRASLPGGRNARGAARGSFHGLLRTRRRGASSGGGGRRGGGGGHGGGTLPPLLLRGGGPGWAAPIPWRRARTVRARATALG